MEAWQTEEDQPAPSTDLAAWKLLVVDDEESVLTVTRLAVIDFEYQGRPLELLYARSGQEAREQIAEHPDTAVILLDVVMETDEAGLEFARYVREQQGDHYVRIILRTGQAGKFSIAEVTREYDINDFCEKVDLTADRMYVALYTALRDRDFLLQQDQLRAEIEAKNNRLRVTNEKLEAFARMASHDLQAPLRKMSWRLERAERALQEGAGPDEVQEELDATRRCCVQMGTLFDSMMKYAQLTGTQLVRRSTSLNTVLNSVVNNLESDIRDCGGVVSLPADAGTVLGEENLLISLFQNLVSNALKNARPNLVPVVNVTAEADVLPGTDQSCVRVDVADEGVGFAESHAEVIFKPFERVSSDADYAGAGLGLSIVREITEEHGGHVTASGEPGVGATFSVYLPASS